VALGVPLRGLPSASCPESTSAGFVHAAGASLALPMGRLSQGSVRVLDFAGDALAAGRASNPRFRLRVAKPGAFLLTDPPQNEKKPALWRGSSVFVPVFPGVSGFGQASSSRPLRHRLPAVLQFFTTELHRRIPSFTNHTRQESAMRQEFSVDESDAPSLPTRVARSRNTNYAHVWECVQRFVELPPSSTHKLKRIGLHSLNSGRAYPSLASTRSKPGFKFLGLATHCVRPARS
jgi:hypothetical protein